jgi:hypothetical protein
MTSRGMTFIPSYMKFTIGVEALFQVSLSSLRVCDVGITDGRNL